MASGAERHLDITFIQIVGSLKGHPVFPYFLEKRLAIPTSSFSLVFLLYI